MVSKCIMKKLIVKTIGGFINSTAVLFPTWNGSYSFNLLCKVKRISISEKGRAFLDTAETSFFEIDHHSAALHQWGTGAKNLLFLHGWMSNSQRWLPYVEGLDLNEYTVYALDAPGHGMAKGKFLNLEIFRRALAKSLEQIGGVDTLVCHSLGSLVGGYCYLHNKDIGINRYVIMGSPSGMDAIFTYFRVTLGLSKKAIHNLEAKINSVLQLPHEEVSMDRFFQKVKQPVLLVHDISDVITPFRPIEQASELALGIPQINGQKKEIETFFTQGQDHNLKGEETVEKVIQFIKN